MSILHVTVRCNPQYGSYAVRPFVPTIFVKDGTSILPNLGGRELGLVADAWHEGPGILDEHVVVNLHAGGWEVAACGRWESSGGELCGLLDAMDQRIRKVVDEDRDSLCEGSDELLTNHSLVLNYRHCDEVGAQARAILICAFEKIGANVDVAIHVW